MIATGSRGIRAGGVKKRGRPSKNQRGGGDPNAPLVLCPGKDGKECVERKHGEDFVPCVDEGTICGACYRGRSQFCENQAARIREKRATSAAKAAQIEAGARLRQHLRNDLTIINLAQRPAVKRGLSDPIDVLDIMGLTVSDLGKFHELTVQADREDGELVKLFDYLQCVNGGTFQAHNSHTSRWQWYLHTGQNSNESTLCPEDPVVVKVREGLLKLQQELRKPDIVDGKRQASPLGASGVTFTDPTVLYSRGQQEKANAMMPKECFVTQLFHTDHDADRTAKAAGKVRKTATVPCGPVPYSVLINCTPGTVAIIKGCGLSEDIPEGYDYDNNHVDVKFNCGEMVAFRGDYVHAGSSYQRNHTRIHLNLHPEANSLQDDVNATHVDEQKVAPDNIVDDYGKNAKGAFVGMPPKRIAAPAPSKARKAGNKRK